MKTLNVALIALLSLLFGHKALAEFTGFYPSWGYPGQIIKVQGTDLGRPTIYWDGSLISSTLSPGVYFQIPHDAGIRNHYVELRYDSRSLGLHQIVVRPLRGTWPQPRIEDVAISTLLQDLSEIRLTVSVANGDINSRVRVSMLSDVRPIPVCDPCATNFFSAESSDFFNQYINDPITYGYPVFHYASLLVSIPPRTAIMGRTLVVEVINRDGSSSIKEYKIPLNHAQLDSDNDGLLDRWETEGYARPSNTTQSINLREMGCHPYKKDILVEVDWMPSALPESFITTGNMWDRIAEVYQNAPVLNPDGSTGIQLHIDRGQDRVSGESTPTGPFIQGHTPIWDFDTLDFSRRATVHPRFASFCFLKSRWFDPDRNEIFHYCIIGNAGGNKGSGRAETPGNGFIVTTVRLPNPEIAGSVEAMIGTFIHELGHNLGLHHGGLVTDPPITDVSTVPFSWQLYVKEEYKPNHPSSMNYRYSLRGIDHDCDLCPDFPANHGYSEGMLRDINERSVSESVGICNNRSIDFLFDGRPETVTVNTNGVHPPGADPTLGIGHSRSTDTDATDVFHDYDEWGNLLLNWKSSRLFQSPPAWSWICR